MFSPRSYCLWVQGTLLALRRQVCHLGITVRVGWNQCGRFERRCALPALTGIHFRRLKKKEKKRKPFLEKVSHQMCHKSKRALELVQVATATVIKSYRQIARAFFAVEWCNELSSPCASSLVNTWMRQLVHAISGRLSQPLCLHVQLVALPESYCAKCLQFHCQPYARLFMSDCSFLGRFPLLTWALGEMLTMQYKAFTLYCIVAQGQHCWCF